MNRCEALRESLADEAEGADFLMVKPALVYLDIMADIRRNSLLPLVAYLIMTYFAPQLLEEGL